MRSLHPQPLQWRHNGQEETIPASGGTSFPYCYFNCLYIVRKVSPSGFKDLGVLPQNCHISKFRRFFKTLLPLTKTLSEHTFQNYTGSHFEATPALLYTPRKLARMGLWRGLLVKAGCPRKPAKPPRGAASVQTRSQSPSPVRFRKVSVQCRCESFSSPVTFVPLWIPVTVGHFRISKSPSRDGSLPLLRVKGNSFSWSETGGSFCTCPQDCTGEISLITVSRATSFWLYRWILSMKRQQNL